MIYRLMLASAAAAAMAFAAAGPAAAQGSASDQGWTGFYAGVNLGGVWGDTSANAHVVSGSGTTAIPPADIAAIAATPKSSSNKAGFSGGIEGGYDYQWGNNLLLGAETDFVSFDTRKTSTSTTPSVVTTAPQAVYTVNQSVHTDWLWTFRPRVGYVSGPWLLYGTVGVGVSNLRYELDYNDARGHVGAQQATNTKAGLVWGFGGGYRIMRNWSVKAEYLYADLGKLSSTASNANGYLNFETNTTVKANLIRVGLDYRF